MGALIELIKAVIINYLKKRVVREIEKLESKLEKAKTKAANFQE